MTRFTDMTEFHQGYQFFMLRPSRGLSAFIITLFCTVIAAVIWACIMKMDDVIKATALLRPAQAISTIKRSPAGRYCKKIMSMTDMFMKGIRFYN
jgi:hypothetical protein